MRNLGCISFEFEEVLGMSERCCCCKGVVQKRDHVGESMIITEIVQLLRSYCLYDSA